MVSRRVLAACAGLLALASLAHPAAAADVVDAPFVWVVAPRRSPSARKICDQRASWPSARYTGT